MKPAFAFLPMAILFVLPTMAGSPVSEAEMQSRLCSGPDMEVSLGGMGRADCVSDTHAIEIDWADKWHEGLGQALSYATATGLQPGLVLICRQDERRCLAHSLSAREVFATQGVDATAWECGIDAISLDDCLARETRVAPGP